MKRTPARGSRGATRRETGNETAADRFEFARRHIITKGKLSDKLEEALEAVVEWKTVDEFGNPYRDRRGAVIERKSHTPEDREEFKKLEAAVVDAKARLLLHNNDGKLL